MKRFIAYTSTIFLLLILFSLHGNAQTIDSDRSKVEFKIKNILVNTVKGSFSGMKGVVNFQPNDVAGAFFDVCIDVSTIKTGIEKRDQDLLSASFFDASQFPEICFRSSSVSKTATGFETKGMLKMHGVVREVVIPFKAEENVLTGKLSVNRFDFNVGEHTGTFAVGEDVEITITCVMNHQHG